ncbi:ankyrin repeat domain-containing protein SOWAHC [Scyliorhinus canicula]|uniref:ankyrin repeat domain-containing protein SOWAHC n=1 Tax=Scyliorhinus canicula TaxID=7830 RepID=UPI0018F7A55B|nr:ankyrin repeat domain-containing protein SOWAHC [Scyliorhinus canicula]
MFEKLGEMRQSRFLVAAGPGAPYRPAGDAPPGPEYAGNLAPPKDSGAVSYGAVLEDVNRLSHLLGRFLKTAETSERRNFGANPAEGCGAPGGTSPGRRREAAAPPGSGRSLRKRESRRRDSGASAAEAASTGVRQLCPKERIGGSSEAAAPGKERIGGSSEAAAPGLALEPREHQWMLAAAAGDWAAMEELLLLEPGLLNKRDFISGLTATHWLAKQGKDQALLQLLLLVDSQRWALDLNARAGGGGYTALHLAAMQGHPMVIKLLVGAFNADVDIRDYRGRKAWQYLGSQAPSQLRQLAGMEEALTPGQTPLPPTQHKVHNPAKKPDFSIITSLQRFLKPSSWYRKKTQADL